VGSVFGRQNHVFSTFGHFSKVKSHYFLTSQRLSRFGPKFWIIPTAIRNLLGLDFEILGLIFSILGLDSEDSGPGF